MKLEDRMLRRIGNMVAGEEVAAMQMEQLADEREKAWMLMAEIIRSGEQMSHAEVVAYFQANDAFAAWYRQKFPPA